MRIDINILFKKHIVQAASESE